MLSEQQRSVHSKTSLIGLAQSQGGYGMMNHNRFAACGSELLRVCNSYNSQLSALFSQRQLFLTGNLGNYGEAVRL